MADRNIPNILDFYEVAWTAVLSIEWAAADEMLVGEITVLTKYATRQADGSLCTWSRIWKLWIFVGERPLFPIPLAREY